MSRMAERRLLKRTGVVRDAQGVRLASGSRCTSRTRSMLTVRVLRQPAGVTLIELLFVIALMVLLLSIAIPLLNMNFRDKKLRETARQLNAQFASAKALAASRNRPVGVWFDRPQGRLNECLQVFLAEVPLPYTGDLLDSRAYVRFEASAPIGSTAPTNGRFRLVFDAGKCANLTNSRTLVKLNERVYIRFGYRGPLFPITRLPGVANGAPVTDVFLLETDGYPLPTGFYLPFNPYIPNPLSDTKWGSINNTDPLFAGQAGGTGTGGAVPPNDCLDKPVGLPFQLYLSPRKLSLQPLDVPAGVAIDLGYSGSGPLGTEFDAWLPNNLTPNGSAVVLMFSPSGQVDRLYAGGAVVIPTSTMHFLVGANDQVQPLPANTPSPTVNPRINDANIQNGLALWVSVGPVNGNVTTAENYFNSASPTLDICRQFARSAQTKGGGP
ncbi:MAG: Tfp pilus assembly protein FimT/FimU [Planctomycetota bacterium]